MTTLTIRTVGELAAENPAAINVFEKLGIDYCCGGSMQLEDACARSGITVSEFETLLHAAPAPPEAGIDWSQRTLTDLHAYLVTRYHAHARQELETLEALATKVAGVHGVRHPETTKVAQLVSALSEDMLPHMKKEEMVLFPYVERLETGDAQPGFIRNPIRVMLMEHETVGELLRAVRIATADYALPGDACFSYRELYRRLQEFERETHEHIHLENNVYFPRALQLEMQPRY